jgi:hypothetical protein
MATNSSQRPTHEWPLFVLSVVLIGSLCVLWKWVPEPPADSSWANVYYWAGRLVVGPEKVLCYFCFTWAAFIILNRYLEVRRQRRAFRLALLPTEEGARILPEDARPLQRKVEQQSQRGGPYILSNLIRLALNKYAVSRTSQDVSETIRMQAEVDLGRLVTSMATEHFQAWAIPALGFLGTVRGLAMSFTMAGKENVDQAVGVFLSQATEHLNVAFDCTLVALALSLPVMFLIHAVQRDEEAVVIESQQYCLEHLVNRLCDPEPLPQEAATQRPGIVTRARISR